MAPEIILNKEYECEVDIWSIGVITYILLSGEAPFTGDNKLEINTQILNKHLSFSQRRWRMISEEAKDFVKKALNRNRK